MRPTAILWDWDNTLVDAWGGIHQALNVAFTAHNLPEWTLEETKERVRGGMSESFRALFGKDWEHAVTLFRRHHAVHQLASLQPMPGIEPALDAAAAWVQAVVSNKEGAPLRREVAHLAWQSRFAAVIGADDAPAPKPDPAPIMLALRQIRMKADRSVWYIGDTATDMQAARAAGVTAVLLGDAAHDGGVATLAERGGAPHLHFVTADALAAQLRVLATG